MLLNYMKCKYIDAYIYSATTITVPFPLDSHTSSYFIVLTKISSNLLLPYFNNYQPIRLIMTFAQLSFKLFSIITSLFFSFYCLLHNNKQEQQEVRVSQLFNTLLFIQQEEEQQEVRVSQLFNTLLFTQQQEEQEVRVSQLFNTLLFTQQQEEEEQEVRVSQLFNTLLFTQQQEEEEQEVRVSQLFNTLLFTQQQEGRDGLVLRVARSSTSSSSGCCC